jgi:hypothetical protein
MFLLVYLFVIKFPNDFSLAVNNNRTKIPQVAANMTNGDEGVFTSKLHEVRT